MWVQPPVVRAVPSQMLRWLVGVLVVIGAARPAAACGFWSLTDRERGLEMPILVLSAIDLDDAAKLRAELTKTIDALVHASSLAPSSNYEIAISRERHRDALALALAALTNARASALAPMPPEIVAVDISAAADALGSITGEVTSEDVLDAIFRDFCIGK